MLIYLRFTSLVNIITITSLRNAEPLGRIHEIHQIFSASVDCCRESCQKRDRKGLKGSQGSAAQAEESLSGSRNGRTHLFGLSEV